MPVFQEDHFRICIDGHQKALFGFNTHLTLEEPAQAVS